MRRLHALLGLLVLVACSPSDATEVTHEAALPPRLSKVARTADEPDRVVVRHVLIAHERSNFAKPGRPVEEARELARSLCERIRAGEEMAPLVREHSDDFDPAADEQPGVYRIANIDVAAAPGELPREHVARGFGDVAFSLAVGEVGVVEWSRESSPLGFHVVHRLE